jgi:hypothetical protein
MGVWRAWHALAIRPRGPNAAADQFTCQRALAFGPFAPNAVTVDCDRKARYVGCNHRIRTKTRRLR